MKVFLDTSVLSDRLFPKVSKFLTGMALKEDTFYISVITHFEVLWGYSLAGLSTKNYEDFLNDFNVQVTPLLKSDVEKAAKLKPTKKDILDALIASSSQRLNARLMTFNRGDFKKFLKEKQILVPEF